MIEIKNFRISSNQNSSIAQLVYQHDQDKYNESNGIFYVIRNTTEGLPSFLTVTQFAREARITPQAVRKMIIERRVNAKKMGEQYIISREELSHYLKVR
jgi:excisionase family DNA binding protein